MSACALLRRILRGSRWLIFFIKQRRHARRILRFILARVLQERNTLK